MFRSSIEIKIKRFAALFVAGMVTLFLVPNLSGELRAEDTSELEKLKTAALEGQKFDRAKYVNRVKNRNSHTVGIVSGEISGTYLHFAADLADVLDNMIREPRMRVVPIVGQGGVQNVLDLLFLKGIDMAIIQQGQLSYLQETDPKFFKNIETRVHYVTKLYNSEFHILASKKVGSIKSLRGQNIAAGKRLSSSDVMARSVFKTLDMNVNIINTDLSSAIEMLRNGDVAAVAVLGGAPIRALQEISYSEDMHLLPLDHKAVGINNYFNLIEKYLPTKVTNKHYANLVEKGKAVPSIASGAMLAVYNWAPDSSRYKKLQSFVDQFFDKFDEFLRRPRHPKWHEVSLYANVPGWQRFSPATQWIERRRVQIGKVTSRAEMKIAMDAFVRQYSKVWKVEQITPLQRDDIWAAMIRVFGRWWVQAKI